MKSSGNEGSSGCSVLSQPKDKICFTNLKGAAVKMGSKSNKKYIYFFGGGKADGNESMKNLLGGKGAN